MSKRPSKALTKRTSAKRPLKRQNAGYGTSLMNPPTKYNKPEKKAIDTSQVVSSVTVARQFILTAPLINGCAQGVAGNQRIGRQILMKSLEFTISCQYATPNPTNNQTAPRLVVFYDRQAAVSSPSITSLFTNNDFQAYRTLSSADRFIILIDTYIEPIGGVDALQRTQTFYRKLNLPVMFNSAGGSASDITTGTVQYYFGASDLCAITVTSRIKYTDV